MGAALLAQDRATDGRSQSRPSLGSHGACHDADRLVPNEAGTARLRADHADTSLVLANAATNRQGCKASLRGPLPHASSRLWLQARERWARYAVAGALSRPQKLAEYRKVHSASAGSLRQVLAGLIKRLARWSKSNVRLLCFETGMETAILVVISIGLALSLAHAVGFIR